MSNENEELKQGVDKVSKEEAGTSDSPIDSSVAKVIKETQEDAGLLPAPPPPRPKSVVLASASRSARKSDRSKGFGSLKSLKIAVAVAVLGGGSFYGLNKFYFSPSTEDSTPFPTRPGNPNTSQPEIEEEDPIKDLIKKEDPSRMEGLIEMIRTPDGEAEEAAEAKPKPKKPEYPTQPGVIVRVPFVSIEEPAVEEELALTYSTDGWEKIRSNDCPAGWQARWSNRKNAVASLMLICEDGVIADICPYSDRKHERPEIQNFTNGGGNITFVQYPNVEPVSPELQCKTSTNGSFQLFIREHKPSE